MLSKEGKIYSQEEAIDAAVREAKQEGYFSDDAPVGLKASEKARNTPQEK